MHTVKIFSWNYFTINFDLINKWLPYFCLKHLSLGYSLKQFTYLLFWTVITIGLSEYSWEEVKYKLTFWILMLNSTLRNYNGKHDLFFRPKVLLKGIGR